MTNIDAVLILLSRLNPLRGWRNSSRVRPYLRRIGVGYAQLLGALCGRSANSIRLPRQRPYGKNLLEATSQLLAAVILGTDPDLTFSAQVGRLLEAGTRRGRWLSAVIDFFWGAGHCRDAWRDKI